MDESPEAWLLEERSATERYVFIIVSDSFDGWRVMWLYYFVCPPKPRRWSILSVTDVKRDVVSKGEEV